MYQDPVKTILYALDSQLNSAMGYEEISEWPEGALPALIDSALLERSSDAEAVTCVECGESHGIRIKYGDDGIPIRAYHECPNRDDISCVKVPFEKLATWSTNASGIAVSIARELGIDATPSELIPDRFWRLGAANIAACPYEVYLVRGVNWEDAKTAFETELAVVSRPEALILTPTDESFPFMPCYAETISLDSLLQITDGRMRLSTDLLSDIISSRTVPSAARLHEIFRVSDEGRSVNLHGVVFDLTPHEAAIVACLWKAARNGTPGVSESFLLKQSKPGQERLRDVFKDRNWKGLIVHPKGTQLFRLNV